MVLLSDNDIAVLLKLIAGKVFGHVSRYPSHTSQLLRLTHSGATSIAVGGFASHVSVALFLAVCWGSSWGLSWGELFTEKKKPERTSLAVVVFTSVGQRTVRSLCSCHHCCWWLGFPHPLSWHHHLRLG